MKRVMRSIAVMLIIVLSVTATGVTSGNCQNFVSAKTIINATRTKSKPKIKLNKKKATIIVKKSLKLKLNNAKAQKIQWRSSNKKVATVSRTGRVRARKIGKVTITAKYKGKRYQCRITVKKAIKPNNSKIDKLTLQQAVFLTDNLYNKKNIIVSPTSLNMVLGMVANAAGPNARKDMEGYLGKSVGAYNQFALNMMNRAENDKMLSLANGVWYKDCLTINPLFANNITKYYKGKIKAAPLDDTTVDDINQWASDKTEGMIPVVIEKMPSYSSSILLNALLFKGKWTSPFEASDTQNGKFQTASNGKVNAKMMNGQVGAYYENEYAVGFEKSYGENQEYSFIAILPKKKGDFKLADLDLKNFLNTKTYEYDVNIQIPKFTYSWRDSLKETLQKTKIKSIFSDQISNLFYNTNEDFFVDDVFQSCKIIMDEDGTKAAAVTVAIVKATSIIVNNKMKTVKLDRPFAYIITDNTTNEVMFMGKVIDVSQK